MRCGWDVQERRRRSEVAGRPVDVRTHIGVRFAVIPLSGVAEAMLKDRSRVIYTPKLRKLSTPPPKKCSC